MENHIRQSVRDQKKTIVMRKPTTKKTTARILTPLSGFAAMIALGVPGANAQTPVFSYQFPASYNGTGSTITDLSAAGNNGTFDGTLSLSPSVPPSASGQSLVTTTGGVLTSGNGTLNNTAIAANNGFTFNVAFMWNGTDLTASAHTQKIIDYSGTESLQLVTTTGSASLQMQFADNTGTETIASSTTIVPNTWYDVELTYDTTGNVIDGNGDITGMETMFVNGQFVSTVSATKGTYGDGLNRPIGIGQLGARFGYLVGLKGDIYDPSVTFGPAVVPEPTSFALMGLGGLAAAWKLRRRKE
jgi:hypothetical protein